VSNCSNKSIALFAVIAFDRGVILHTLKDAPGFLHFRATQLDQEFPRRRGLDGFGRYVGQLRAINAD
jgi:hypothetical protein